MEPTQSALPPQPQNIQSSLPSFISWKYVLIGLFILVSIAFLITKTFLNRNSIKTNSTPTTSVSQKNLTSPSMAPVTTGTNYIDTESSNKQ